MGDNLGGGKQRAADWHMAVLGQIELNRASASWRLLSGAPPGANKITRLGPNYAGCWLARRIFWFWPKPDIFIRRGSLWATIPISNPGKIPAFCILW